MTLASQEHDAGSVRTHFVSDQIFGAAIGYASAYGLVRKRSTRYRFAPGSLPMATRYESRLRRLHEGLAFRCAPGGAEVALSTGM